MIRLFLASVLVGALAVCVFGWVDIPKLTEECNGPILPGIVSAIGLAFGAVGLIIIGYYTK